MYLYRDGLPARHDFQATVKKMLDMHSVCLHNLLPMQTACIQKLGFLTLLAACVLSACTAGSKQTTLGPTQQQVLDNSLKVSAAAIETGQPLAAGRLYEQLSDTFPSAPEPKLGLAYMALHAGDFARADALFIEAGSLATQPAIKAEALLGAGRASLGREDLAGAKTHFLAAADLAEGVRVKSWVMNGLAVVATFEGDYPLAEQRYNEALALVSHPLITANLTRMLVEAGRLDEARLLYSRHDASYWMESDGAELSRLLEHNDDSSGTGNGNTQTDSC